MIPSRDIYIKNTSSTRLILSRKLRAIQLVYSFLSLSAKYTISFRMCAYRNANTWSTNVHTLTRLCLYNYYVLAGTTAGVEQKKKSSMNREKNHFFARTASTFFARLDAAYFSEYFENFHLRNERLVIEMIR